MSYLLYNIFGDNMIEFLWNNVLFEITNIGGGSTDEAIPRHAHASNSYELHFITAGQGLLFTDTKKYQLKKNDFFITGPNFYHSQCTENGERIEDVFLTLQAEDTKNANAVSSVFLSNTFCYFENFNTAVARMLLEEYREKRPDYATAVTGLAIKLLTDISRLLLPKDFKDIVDGFTGDRRFVLIEQAFLYDENITLTELSEKIGLCERQTQRLLKKYYGKTFREKKRETRQG